MRRLGVRRAGAGQLRSRELGHHLGGEPLHLLAVRALNFSRHVSICQLIDNNIKLFNINRVTQQSDFDPFLVFTREFAEKIVF